MSLRLSRSLFGSGIRAALALCLGLAAAGAAHGEGVDASTAGRPWPFRLTSPSPGETWVAGTWVTLAWEAAGDPADRDGLEEWEAFLSVDGGKTYAVRLTPHLDIDLNRFTFEVPRLPTRHARLLLRFGDERQEYGFETPVQFGIAAGPPSYTPFGDIVFSRPRSGEAARGSDPGAVLWLEGSRRGGEVRTAVARPLRTSLSQAVFDAWPPFFFLGGFSSQRVGLPRPAASPYELPDGLDGPLPAIRDSVARPLSIRLLIHRFNE